jgi:hypothetical protein
MYRSLQQRIGAVALGMAGGLALPAAADYTVYEQDDTKAAVSLNLIAAGFDNSDSWFGESESFVGEDTDGWMEFGGEAGINFETGLGRGTLYGALSGVYTATENDDASGLTVGLDDTDDFTLEQRHLG